MPAKSVFDVRIQMLLLLRIIFNECKLFDSIVVFSKVIFYIVLEHNELAVLSFVEPANKISSTHIQKLRVSKIPAHGSIQ